MGHADKDRRAAPGEGGRTGRGTGARAGGGGEPSVWHELPAAAVLAALGVDRAGLSHEEWVARQARYGANELPRPRRQPVFLVYLRQFRSPLIYLLLMAAAVAIALGETADALFIFAVLQINAVIGTVQEWRAESSARALESLIDLQAVVTRDRQEQTVPARDLVPGDIVHVQSGDRVPADLRLLWCRDLQANESLLTGEVLPVAKNADAGIAAAAPLGDRLTLLYAGTLVQTGRATGVVVTTGTATEMGRIADSLTEASPPLPLVVRLERFSRNIGLVMGAVILVLGIAQWLQGAPLAEIFFTAIALAVAAIPEGLPVAITVALSVGVARMSRRNVIVRSLPAVEGLGACTIIASDKTGTLTRNSLTATHLWLPRLGDVEIVEDGAGVRFLRDGAAVEREAEMTELLLSAALCNEARLCGPETDPRQPLAVGDAVDVALLLLAARAGVMDGLGQACPQVGLLPFEPERRFSASLHQAPQRENERGNQTGNQGVRQELHLKGAAETIITMCDPAPELEAGLEMAGAQANRLAAKGYRVLAVARAPVFIPGEISVDTFLDRLRPGERVPGLRLLGFVGIIDPLRPEVPEALERCRGAGVRVCMITGDHRETAIAVGRQAGLFNAGHPGKFISADVAGQVTTGPELAAAEASPERLLAIARKTRIFARIAPLQKLVIVEALQRAGHMVAVTGDGVNDAPALNRADIGVAMGKAGTDVARGAADLILTDDNFASIVAGIEEGRIAYANVRKVIYLLVSTGAAELVLFFLSILAGLPLPLFAVQLLWLNLVTNGIQHVALAFEKGEPDSLEHPPRPPGQQIFDAAMIRQVVLSGAVMGIIGFSFFYWALAQGWSEAAARNALLLLMVLFENVHVFNCRAESRSAFAVPLANNLFVVLAVIGAQGMHVAAMYLPGLREILEIAPVSLGTWFALAGLAGLLVFVMELYKLWLRRVLSRDGRKEAATPV